MYSTAAYSCSRVTQLVVEQPRLSISMRQVANEGSRRSFAKKQTQNQDDDEEEEEEGEGDMDLYGSCGYATARQYTRYCRAREQQAAAREQQRALKQEREEKRKAEEEKKRAEEEREREKQEALARKPKSLEEAIAKLVMEKLEQARLDMEEKQEVREGVLKKRIRELEDAMGLSVGDSSLNSEGGEPTTNADET